MADKWQDDLPEGTEQPEPCKYDVDYSRFNNIADVEENTVSETRDWYVDEKGQTQSISKQAAAAPSSGSNAASTSEEREMNLKKGFLDGTKKALYPKGSEQKAPANEEQLMQEFMKEPGLLKELSGLLGDEGGPGGAAPVEQGKFPPKDREAASKPAIAKMAERKAPAFTLSEVSDGLQLVVSVPELSSMEGVELDVTERQATLVFPAEIELRPLQVELPLTVAPTLVRAKFSKKTKQITVALPAPTVVPAKAG